MADFNIKIYFIRISAGISSASNITSNLINYTTKIWTCVCVSSIAYSKNLCKTATSETDFKQCGLMWKGGCLIKVHVMQFCYLYKTATFPHQPLKSDSKVAFLHRFHCNCIFVCACLCSCVCPRFLIFLWLLCVECICKIERKAMIRNRYNYPTSPIGDIKGKETQTRIKWTLDQVCKSDLALVSFLLTTLCTC